MVKADTWLAARDKRKVTWRSFIVGLRGPNFAHWRMSHHRPPLFPPLSESLSTQKGTHPTRHEEEVHSACLTMMMHRNWNLTG